MSDRYFAEVFAGGGGLSRGLELAGWNCRWHCEIDPQPRAVLEHRFPGVPLYGDVLTVDGRELVERHGRLDLLSGGSPCQGLSAAGRGEGLADHRSVLFYQQMRLWDETGADLCLWENVDGARYNNGGEDFAEVLRAFVGAPLAIPSTGWRGAGVAVGPAGVAAWRVLDSQFLGVPQRRSRLFVLGTRAGSVDPAEVLSLAEGVRRHSSSSKGAGQVAPTIVGGGAGTMRVGDPKREADFCILDRERGVADPITASEGDTYTHEGSNNFRTHNVLLEEGEAIAFNTKQDGHDASAGVAPTLLAMPHDRSHANGGGQLGVVSFDGRNQLAGPVSHALRSDADSGDHVVAFDLAQITHPENRSTVTPGAPSPTLNRSGAVHVFNEVGQEKWQQERIAGTTTAHEAKEPHTIVAIDGEGNVASDVAGALETHHSSHNRGAILDIASPLTTRSGPAPDRGDGLDNIVIDPTDDQLEAFAFKTAHYTRGKDGAPSSTVPTLTADADKGDSDPVVFTGVGVPRRLLPIECERLMGWPDNWTAVPDPKSKTGKILSDSARYRICGNGVTSVHAQWIGWRLMLELER